ncbi:hypothetical protein B0H13DRAFT_1115134 [Mycena leptocephala]|nr:hypothetical protein B0H13DRAFT_1115134 [Mycena leptocephala]
MFLAHLVPLLLYVLVADSVVPATRIARRRGFSALDSSPRRYTHCARVFDAPLRSTLLHPPAPPTSTCASARPDAALFLSALPPHSAVRRTSAPTGIMYFCAPMTDCTRMVIDSDRGVAEKPEMRWMYVWVRVRVQVYMPWKEGNTRERRMGGEMERGGRRRTHCDAGPPPCGRSASGWDSAIGRLPTRGESPPGQLIHSSLDRSARSRLGASWGSRGGTLVTRVRPGYFDGARPPLLRQSHGEYALKYSRSKRARPHTAFSDHLRCVPLCANAIFPIQRNDHREPRPPPPTAGCSYTHSSRTGREARFPFGDIPQSAKFGIRV